MGSAAKPSPELNQEDWNIIIELLERERNELPIEIRHTFRHAFRDQLQQRLNVIESLLERLTAWKSR